LFFIVDAVLYLKKEWKIYFGMSAIEHLIKSNHFVRCIVYQGGFAKAIRNKGCMAN